MRDTLRLLLQGALLVILLLGVMFLSRWLLVADPMVAEVPPTPTVPDPLPSPTPAPPTATSTPTPTPEPTFTPTATFTPSPTFTPSSTPPAPVAFHATPILDPIPEPSGTEQPYPQPTPMNLISQPEGTINIVLLGADQPTGTSRGRTDVIVVVSINPDIPSVSMLSIPRDFYVWIPTYGFGKINTADSHGGNYPGGGPALLKATIEYNLGIPIHYYARVNFDGFVRIVDTLGGVDVPVECELHDTFPDPANPEEGIDVDLMPGVQHLDGQHALWYARSRWSTSDFDRNRRQQQILRALYHKIRELDFLSRVPELWSATQETVETDLGVREAAWLGLIGGQLDFANVKSRFLAPPYLASTTAPSGAYILLPVDGAIEPLVAEALQPPASGRAAQAALRVEVWDGTGRPGMAQVAVERLRWEGFHVVAVETIDPVPRTQIVDFTTSDKGSPLWLLRRLYERQPEDVIQEPTEGSPVDLRITLGADYNPCVSRYAIQYVPAPTPTPSPEPTPTPP